MGVLVVRKTKTPFETVIITLLVLIYLRLTGYAMDFGNVGSELSLGSADSFRELEKVLNARENPNHDTRFRKASEHLEEGKTCYSTDAPFSGVLPGAPSSNE